jgi:hypothetical protein
VNIIFESLKKILKLRKPQSIPFVVWMAYQWKVQPIGLITNLKINLVTCDYKISIIVLNMENGVETYSMLLGWPWLKVARTHHNWGDNTFTMLFIHLCSLRPIRCGHTQRHNSKERETSNLQSKSNRQKMWKTCYIEMCGHNL